MSPRYSDRHAKRFYDDLEDRTGTLIPEKSTFNSKTGLTVAFGHRGMEFNGLHETWDFDVVDVRATGQVVYVEIEVHGRIDD